ncbi:MAG: NADH-quinone oxidoreductase subunit C [Planctomycetota bacterium]
MIDYEHSRKIASIAEILRETFGEKIRSIVTDDLHPRAEIDVADWRPMAEFLRFDPRLSFDFLLCLTAIDDVADHAIIISYELRSMALRQEFAIKVRIDRDHPTAPTVSDIWPTADWHEREAYDLFGIQFEGHPNLMRILLPDDWEGYPLRKDYEFPESYEGIPMSYEMHWERPTPPAEQAAASDKSAATKAATSKAVADKPKPKPEKATSEKAAADAGKKKSEQNAARDASATSSSSSKPDTPPS